MVLEFDKATDYLIEMLSKCDSTVLATCINLAVHSRNFTGTLPEKAFLYAKPLQEQQIELTPTVEQ